MSSTTSSDCESCDCSHCTYSFENNQNDYGNLMTNSRHVPIYATMAHPLIYYAEVQPLNRRQFNNQPRKDNPFKKAFKWYTQERGRMLSNKTEVCPERSGFANWLDDKYDEYLRENGPTKPAMPKPPMTYEPQTPQNSIVEPEQCPGASQRFGRFKSPWRKRRTSVNDGGDVPEKGPCGSCEYILKPKDLTRATSEHTPTSGGKSTVTVTSSNMPCNTKCSGRSRSLSDVGRERSVPRHGDTLTHFAQGPKYQEQDPARMPTMNYQEQVVQVPSKNQGPVTCKCPHCLCPSEKVPEVIKMPPKIQVQPCCPCPPEKVQEEVEKEPPINQNEPFCEYHQEKVPQVEKPPSKTKSKTKNPRPLPSQEISEILKIPSIKQDPTELPYCTCPQEKNQDELQEEVQKEPPKKQNQPCCMCHQEKIPQVEKLPSKTISKTKNPKPIPSQEKSEVVKVPSIKQDPTKLPYCPCPQKKVQDELQEEVQKEPPKKQNQPCCMCQQEKIPQVEKLPSKTISKTKNPKPIPSQEKSEVVKVPSIKQDPTKLPYCPCPREKESKVEKLQSLIQDPTYLPSPAQETLSEVVKVPSKVPSKTQDPKNRPITQQEKAPEVEKVPSKAQDAKNQPKPEQEKAPQVVKVPSKGQEPTDQPGPCCKCNLKKVPEVVQVPSQSRAVQESCQVPEDKVVPVNEGTQYDSAQKPPRSTQNVRPCCCNTCNPPFPPPPPPIICLPVKVQSSKISSPDICLNSPSAICDVPKKQKKATQRRSVSCQFDEGNKSKDTQCQHQNEPCSCSKPCCGNCHSINHVCDPNSIRRQSYSTVAISEETGEVSIVKEVAVVNKFSRSVTCASNDAAQTSDHSICFDKDGICSCQCPLFLKIIYADIKE